MYFLEWADKHFPNEKGETLAKMSLAWSAGVIAHLYKESEKDICDCKAYTNIIYLKGVRRCEICFKLENKGG